jgi:hypothetical protein
MSNYAVQSPTNPMRGLFRGDAGYSFGAPVGAAIAASPTGLVRAAGGIVTLTTTGNHNFAPGEVCTVFDVGRTVGTAITSVGGTRFGGNYLIQAVPSATTLTLLPLDDVILHQAPDTGGGGEAISPAYESPAAPQAGQAFALNNRGDNSMSPWGFFVDGIFSAAPGAFEVDIQGAFVDADAEYSAVPNGAITTLDTNNTVKFHLDATWTGINFVRGKIISRTNAVGLILRFRG